MNFNFYEALLIFVRGLLMGSADIVPGVSGGTIALITGIYDKLIYSISKINFKFIKPLVKLDFKGFWTALLDEIDFAFFIPLILGIGVAMLTISRVIGFCMVNYTSLTYSFFIGLILASALILLRKIPKLQITHIVFVVIGLVFTYIFVNLNPIATNHSLPVLFVSGMVAICAMILPGVSGSFLLLLLNQYEYMLTALYEFHIVEIIVFIIGAVIGILGFSKILNYLIKNYEEYTMACLIGVMVGSLALPLDLVTSSTTLDIAGVLPCVISAIVAFVLIFILETRFTRK